MAKPILCLDFDGVVHMYTSPWTTADTISDGPVPGALEFIHDAMVDFDVHIFSSRSHQPQGIAAMKSWLGFNAALDKHASWFRDGKVDLAWIDNIVFPLNKPPAMITIDDRALTFQGIWPDMPTLLAFKPWNKR